MTDAPAPTVLNRWRVISCREYGPVPVDLGDVLGPDGRLRLAPGVLDHYVSADFQDGRVRLLAKGVSGLVPLTDGIAIQVRPRFPLSNLTRMVTACGYTPVAISALREYQATEDQADWLLDVLTESLLAGMRSVVAGGLLRTYVRRTEASSFPHGRIDTSATMRLAARGLTHRVQYSWFERTVDNPPNRCLKSAVAVLHARLLRAPHRRGVRDKVERLAGLMHLLSEVTLEPRPTSLEDPEVRGLRPLPEPRSYYRPVLDLAVAVLNRTGISLDRSEGTVSLPSLLVKTEDLFEDFVRLSLQSEFAGDADIRVLDGNLAGQGRLPLYRRAVVGSGPDAVPGAPVTGDPSTAEPDVVFRRSDGTYPLVADVKYHQVRRDAERADVEQVGLYGVRYRSPVVMTVHPAHQASAKGLHVSGWIGPMLVANYRVDLGAEDLEAEMAEMAQRVSELLEWAGRRLAGAPPPG